MDNDVADWIAVFLLLLFVLLLFVSCCWLWLCCLGCSLWWYFVAYIVVLDSDIAKSAVVHVGDAFVAVDYDIMDGCISVVDICSYGSRC